MDFSRHEFQSVSIPFYSFLSRAQSWISSERSDLVLFIAQSSSQIQTAYRIVQGVSAYRIVQGVSNSAWLLLLLMTLSFEQSTMVNRFSSSLGWIRKKKISSWCRFSTIDSRAGSVQPWCAATRGIRFVSTFHMSNDVYNCIKYDVCQMLMSIRDFCFSSTWRTHICFQFVQLSFHYQ